MTQPRALRAAVRFEDSENSCCAAGDTGASRSEENNAQASPFSFPRPKDPKSRELTRLCRACQSVLTDLHEWVHVAGSVNHIPEECLLAVVTDWLVSNMMGSSPSPMEFFLAEKDETSTESSQHDATSGLSDAPDSEGVADRVFPRQAQVGPREILGEEQYEKVAEGPNTRKSRQPFRGQRTVTKTIEVLLGMEGAKRSVVRCKWGRTRYAWVFRSPEQARHFAYDLARW